MHQGDYASYYQFPTFQNPNPNPNPNPPNSIDHHQTASAPPFSPSYPPNDYSAPILLNLTLLHLLTLPIPQLPPATRAAIVFPAVRSPSDPGASYAAAPPPPPPASNPIAGAPYVSYSSLNPVGSSVPPVYDNQYENSPKFDHGVGYFDDKYGIYNRVGLIWGWILMECGQKGGLKWVGMVDMVMVLLLSRWEGGAVRGTRDGTEVFNMGGGQSTMDVLCQIGLDGIKMLDPNTSRTLRIYPLENITRCDKMDSSTFAFWSKSSVDVEPRRIRLQSNSYTTSTLLDTVTAATIQLKEMGGRPKPSDHSKISEQTAERKKGFGDWMNFIKPANEEKDHWVPDEAVMKCTGCGTDFNAFIRRHHCRNCGDIFCDKCTHGRIALTAEENASQLEFATGACICVLHVLGGSDTALTNTKEAASKPAGLISHEDLARNFRYLREMERNRKTSSGSKSSEGSSGKRMREVACPTCTVHLQVQVPSSGSETIECGVCQHPFLVSAH
ncbi:unnamed protein product [Linum tenue]|uniref:FYVE-type domain-containing protein n=1 Tax=Linum tenue TaxID=586396 RepID=A0AAV0MLJ8_9ROSI|nr:unnamed protein product [Linum tenue]